MEIIQAIILGLVQGIAEWLPVSSEGLSSLIMINFFNMSFANAITIAIWLHLGTLLSAVVYFRKDIKIILQDVIHILKNFKFYSFNDKKLRLTNFLIVSTFITAIIGGAIYLLGLTKFDIAASVATAIIGVMLLITGLIILLAKKTKLKKEIKMKDSILLGAVQGLSIIPGISRSGITTSTLLMRKYNAQDALKISFLMSIPAVLVAMIGLIIFQGVIINLNSLIAVVLAFVTGLLTIKVMLKLAEKINFAYFCLGFGVLILLSIFIL